MHPVRRSLRTLKLGVRRYGYRVQRDRYKRLQGEKITGWLTPDECQRLHLLALTLRGPILEIGHFLGRSTACICEGIQDSGVARRFDSFDLGFQSGTDLANYYARVMGRIVSIPDLYEQNVYRHKTTTSEVARRNLDNAGLIDYVNLVSGNFIDCAPFPYAMIFCDAVHSAEEIAYNLPFIIERSGPNCLWAFHDMDAANIASVQEHAEVQLIDVVDTLALFVFERLPSS